MPSPFGTLLLWTKGGVKLVAEASVKEWELERLTVGYGLKIDEAARVVHSAFGLDNEIEDGTAVAAS